MKSFTTPIIISIVIGILIIGGAVAMSSKKDIKNISNPDLTIKIDDSVKTIDQKNSTSTNIIPVIKNTPKADSSSNVSIENGVQIITLQAKGGYSPRQSVAKAGIPTVIRFVTNNTFDCSISIRIPSLNLSKYLPQTGSTDINIGTQSAGTFRGSCGMGMYPFEVEFK